MKIIKAPQAKTLSDILPQTETLWLLSQFGKMRYRVLLITIYSMGLRISEFPPADICSERMIVHIRNSKLRSFSTTATTNLLSFIRNTGNTPQ